MQLPARTETGAGWALVGTEIVIAAVFVVALAMMAEKAAVAEGTGH